MILDFGFWILMIWDFRLAIFDFIDMGFWIGDFDFSLTTDHYLICFAPLGQGKIFCVSYVTNLESLRDIN